MNNKNTENKINSISISPADNKDYIENNWDFASIHKSAYKILGLKEDTILSKNIYKENNDTNEFFILNYSNGLAYISNEAVKVFQKNLEKNGEQRVYFHKAGEGLAKYIFYRILDEIPLIKENFAILNSIQLMMNLVGLDTSFSVHPKINDPYLNNEFCLSTGAHLNRGELFMSSGDNTPRQNYYESFIADFSLSGASRKTNKGVNLYRSLIRFQVNAKTLIEKKKYADEIVRCAESYVNSSIELNEVIEDGYSPSKLDESLQSRIKENLEKMIFKEIVTLFNSTSEIQKSSDIKIDFIKLFNYLEIDSMPLAAKTFRVYLLRKVIFKELLTNKNSKEWFRRYYEAFL